MVSCLRRIILLKNGYMQSIPAAQSEMSAVLPPFCSEHVFATDILSNLIGLI
jgi:hypothetical protein